MPPASANSLVLLDWAVILVYLVVILGIGWWSMRRIKDAGTFLLADRKLGKVLSMASAFSTGVNAQDPIQIASKTYQSGLSGIWISLQFLLLTPWFWITAPVGRRIRTVTGLDMIRLRMGRPVEMLNFVFGLLTAGFGIAVGLKAAVIAIVATSGGEIGETTAAAMIVVPTMIYCLMGGILAICVTDIFMSMLVIVLSFILIPFALWKLGGIAAVAPPAVPASHFDLISSSGIGWWALVWLVVGSIFSIGVPGPSAARNEVAARVGTLGLLVKRICTVGWAAIGIFAVALFGTAAVSGIRPDDIFARMSLSLLPDGLRGVMVASVLAAVMDTVAIGMIGFAGNIVNNLYRPFVRPTASAREYLLVARLCAAVNVLLGWAIMTVVKTDIVNFFLSTLFLGAIFGVPLLLCFLWRGVTAYGAVAGVVVMGIFYTYNNLPVSTPFWYQWLVEQTSGLYAALGSAEGQVVDGRIPIEIKQPLFLISGILTIVGVSLVTPQHNARNVRDFYARLDTPVGEEQSLIDQGIQVDLIENIGGSVTVAAGSGDIQRRLLLVDLLYLPWLLWTGRARLRDYWLDALGIVGSMVFIGLFLLTLQWLAHLFVR